MRRPNQLRLAAFSGVLVSLGFALILSFIVFMLTGRAGRLGFEDFNTFGLLEGVVFVISYSLGLLYTRMLLRIPSPMLLSFGLVAPPTAARAALDVPVIDADQGLHSLMENRVVIVAASGVPYGVTGVKRERVSAWEEVVKVDGRVAVTELRGVLAHEPLVIVTTGSDIAGIITQEMYLAGLWGTLR